MRKLRKNDKVIVTVGKSKGAVGQVLKFVSNDRCLIGGVNLVKKHQKPNPQKGVSGGIIEIESSVHVSNVSLLNPETNKADKVFIHLDENGRKVRKFRSDGSLVSGV